MRLKLYSRTPQKILGALFGLSLVLSCKAPGTFSTGEKAKIAPIQSNTKDLEASPSEPGSVQENDRPSESNPGVPGYFLFCKESSVNNSLPLREKDFHCGVADASNDPVQPYAVEWNLSLGSLDAQVTVIKTLMTIPGPVLVHYHLSVPESVDPETLASQVKFDASVRMSEASEALNLSSALPDVLAIQPKSMENVDLLGPKFPFRFLTSNIACSIDSGAFPSPDLCQLTFPDPNINKGSGKCSVTGAAFSCADCNMFGGGICCTASSCSLISQ